MNGKSTTVGLLGIGLLGMHFFNSADGEILRKSISNAEGPDAPKTSDAHAALAKFGGLLLFVIIATIASAGSNDAGNVFIAFFVLMWFVWIASHTSAVSSLQNKVTPGKIKQLNRLQ